MKSFYPDYYYRSAYDIPYGELYREGFRGIIFDIDNTLVPHGKPADSISRALVKELKELGFRVIFMSNNKETRVKPFAEIMQLPYIHKAGKPAVGNYRRAAEILGVNREKTVFVGDQLFTDVWGAKRADIRAYLVQPIDRKEEIQIVLKRYLEKIVLFFYRKKCEKEKKVYLYGRKQN